MATGKIPMPVGAQNRTPSVTANLITISPTESDPYVFPTDGYVVIYNNDETHIGRIQVTGAPTSTNYIQIGNALGRFALFVRAGMSCFLGGSTPSTARFVSLQ